jgi:hypothetical protein
MEMIFYRPGERFDLVKFVVYYDHGTVRTTSVGVDLSEFWYVELELSAPQT